MTHRVTDLHGFLRGLWRLERRILDRFARDRGFLSGDAEYRDADRDLLYREAGTLRFGGRLFPVSRSYRYIFPEAHVAEVRFDPGGLFHELDLSKGFCTVAHRCGKDLYRGRFRVLDEDSLFVAWHVTGPRKDQVLKSRYRRP